MFQSVRSRLDDVRETYDVPNITDHEFQVIRQGFVDKNGGVEIICTEWSQTFNSLNKSHLVYRVHDKVMLTPRGQDLHSYLIENKKLFEKYTTMQTVVLNLRTAWGRRPRLPNRFVIRTLVWKMKQWWVDTSPPKSPMIDFSAFKIGWSEADDREQREVWRDSGFLAFWLCPDGIERGIEIHDEYTEMSPRDRDRFSNQLAGISTQTAPEPHVAYCEKEAERLRLQGVRAGELYKKTKSRRNPCGCYADVTISHSYQDHSAKVLCSLCRRAWIPASRNVREIASDSRGFI